VASNIVNKTYYQIDYYNRNNNPSPGEVPNPELREYRIYLRQVALY
jgi:hypothetical protein